MNSLDSSASEISQDELSRPRTPDASEQYRQFKANRNQLNGFEGSDTDSRLEYQGSNISLEDANDQGILPLSQLYDLVYQYAPLEIELDTVLEPFVPEFVPAIGDIDAFIKIPRPDGLNEKLGLEVLDEPSIDQSNQTILEIKLKSLSKTNVNTKVHSIKDTKSLKTNSKELNNWISSLKELHSTRPASVVKYSRPMPQVEHLMQAWEPEIEHKLRQIEIPIGTNDIPLDEYCKLILATLDIPVKNDQNSLNSRSTIESLHVLLTLYSAFNQSHHFQ